MNLSGCSWAPQITVFNLANTDFFLICYSKRTSSLLTHLHSLPGNPSLRYKGCYPTSLSRFLLKVLWEYLFFLAVSCNLVVVEPL